MVLPSGDTVASCCPRSIVSFAIAGVICACAALAYAEMATMIPASGSAYTYSYVVIGELLAWVVGWALRLDPRHVPIAERFAAAGYATAGFFCCGSFWSPDKKTGYSRGVDSVFIDPEGDVLVEEARRWIAARHAGGRPASPSFAWLHFIEPHNWMKRKDGGQRRKDSRQRRYDKALAEVDGFLRIVAAIEALPPEQQPILLVTSDHGEGLVITARRTTRRISTQPVTCRW